MTNISKLLTQLHLPAVDSHKGQNGKLLIIGGSELFHAASKWSLDIASKFVDMVFYASVPSNNALIHEAKGQFWNGIVIPRAEIENYLSEADCILIGPGMTRDSETETLTNTLLERYPDKKWVIDAGALQMAEPSFFNQQMILTPHHQELELVLEHAKFDGEKDLTQISEKLNGATILLKGKIDQVTDGQQLLKISGGNAGMTKGGTGDALAGLVAGLYCANPAFLSAAVASCINKNAGDDLYEHVGPNFNTSDLVQQIPQTLWREYRQVTSK